MNSNDPPRDPYHSYREWKGWHDLFRPSPQEKVLFEKEFRAIALHGKKLLDFGFGSGALLAWAQSKGALVVGIEIQDALQKAAAHHHIPTYNSIFDIPDESFDVIVFFDVLEHIHQEGIQDVLRESYRIAKKGGVVLIRVPNCQSPAGLAIQFADPTHMSMLSGPIVKALLEDAHFQTIDVREAQLQPSSSSLNRVLRRVSRPLIVIFEVMYRLTWSVRHTPLSSNVMIIAHK